MEDLIDETDATLAEVEQNINSHLTSFEAEAEKLRQLRAKLLAARERTDKTLVRIDRVIRALKPEVRERKPAKAKGKQPSISPERVGTVKAFIIRFLKDNEFVTRQDVRNEFDQWAESQAYAAVNALGNSLIEGHIPSDFEAVIKAMSNADRMRLTRLLSQQAGGTRQGVRTAFRREWNRNAVLNVR